MSDPVYLHACSRARIKHQRGNNNTVASAGVAIPSRAAGQTLCLVMIREGNRPVNLTPVRIEGREGPDGGRVRGHASMGNGTSGHASGHLMGESGSYQYRPFVQRSKGIYTQK